MRVLLCQSHLGVRSFEPLVFPLGLSYLASRVKDKHELRCWDPNVSKNPAIELPEVISEFNPEVVGVSLRNIDSVFSFNRKSYYPPFVSTINSVRKSAPTCKLVVGGTGFSIFAEEILRNNPEIDYGIVSEGENAFAELLENFDHPDRVKGLILRRGNRLVLTENQDWALFGDLPAPARELFDVDKYKNHPYAVGVQPKRGCVFGCIFCPSRVIWGCPLRIRQPEKVVDEIEMLVNDFDLHSFSFAEAAFNFPWSYSHKLCRELIRRKLEIKWAAAFNPAFVNQDSIEEAVKAGCELFSFSPDGASSNAMRLLGKNFDVQAVEKTISLVRKTEGAKAGYSFLYDLPKYNGEHVLGLARLTSKIIAELGQKLRFLSFSKIRIYPQTTMYTTALKDGRIAENTNLLLPTYYESPSSLNPSSLLPGVLRGALKLLGEARSKIEGDSTFKLCS